MLMLGRAMHTVAGEQLIAAGLPQRAAHGPGVQQPRRIRRRARDRLEQGERRVSAGRPGSGCGVRAGGQQRHEVPVRDRAWRRARGVRAAVCSALGTARRRHLVVCRQSLPQRNAVRMPVQRSAAESGMCMRGTEACAALPGRLLSSPAVRQHCCMCSCPGLRPYASRPSLARRAGGWSPAHRGRGGMRAAGQGAPAAAPAWRPGRPPGSAAPRRRASPARRGSPRPAPCGRPSRWRPRRAPGARGRGTGRRTAQPCTQPASLCRLLRRRPRPFGAMAASAARPDAGPSERGSR